MDRIQCQVWIDRTCAVAKQRCKVMYLSWLAGLQNQCQGSSPLRAHQILMYRRNCQQRGNRHPNLINPAVSQDQNICAIPASHGEGRFVADKEWLAKLFANGQVATQCCDPEGNVLAGDEEWNVNGSYLAIEGITSPDGRVLGKMAHSERRGDSVAINIYGEQDMKIFESGVAYFK